MVHYFYKDDKLVDHNGKSVMMGWERPIMKKVAEIICSNGGDILNIGFGMGIVDSYISEYNISSHAIIEKHPDVYNYLKQNGWNSKENTKVFFDSWQNVLDVVGTFDGIYLDTWCDARERYVKTLLDKNLKVGGIFSMWYNKEEFKNIMGQLDENYEVTFEYLLNDNLIPTQQHENGKTYIEPSEKFITIPIVKKIRQSV